MTNACVFVQGMKSSSSFIEVRNNGHIKRLKALHWINYPLYWSMILFN